MGTDLSNLRAGLMSEEQLLQSIIELAKTFHWLVEHKRPAMLVNGEYRTAIQGDKGGPDLVLARAGVFLLVELKSQKGKLSREQEEWREAGVITLRPSDWFNGKIEKMLQIS